MRTFALPAAAARRFLIRRFGLDGYGSLPRVADALDLLGYIQEDSIPICGRMHDLILWPRVAGYRPEMLEDALYGPDAFAFEEYFPNLGVLHRHQIPWLAARIRARRGPAGRWRGLEPDEEPVAVRVLETIRERGATRTRDLDADDGHTHSGWGMRRTVAGHVAEKLWLHGRLGIARRKNFERWFDLTARTLGDHAAPLEDDAPLPDPGDADRHLRRHHLHVAGLFRLKKSDRDLLGDDAFVAVTLDDDPKPWHALATDLTRLEAARTDPDPVGTLLLAPLDPLVYDRARTLRLFGFDYRWEVYTPEAKRVRGYYALPVLQDGAIVGWVDPKVDRKNGRLDVVGWAHAKDADPKAIRARIGDLARLNGVAPPSSLPRARRFS